MKYIRSFICLIAISCLATFAIGQTPTGIIQGVVTDKTGAVIPGASITITRITTNESRQTKTDSAGRFTLPFVEPGTYTVSAEASGFRPAKQNNVLVQVTETRPVNFVLQVGGATQTVEVNANAQTLDTGTSSMGETIQSKAFLELPDNGRNPFDFAMLVPGVNNVGGASTPHIAGSRNGNNEQLIDGMTNIIPENNIGNNLSAYTPVEDSVQEVNVQTSVLPAEYGRFSGGTESLITKSGGNQWHGSFFEFVQNGGLDAIPFGSPGVKNTKSKPDMHQYQTGGTIGGPILKNRAFFFFDYENSHQAAGAYEADKVPTDYTDFANGDFTSLFGSTTPVLFDPDTVALNSQGIYVRQPFQTNGAYNVIPASRISPVAKAVLAYFPTPNIAGAGAAQNNYQVTQSVASSYWHFDSREDLDVTSKWHSFLRYSMNGNKRSNISDYNNAASQAGSLGHGYDYSGSFNNTVTFSPTLLGEFRYGYSKQTWNGGPVGGSFDPGKLGFDSAYVAQASKRLEVFPRFTFGGANNGNFSSLGPGAFSGLQEDPSAQSINGSLVKIVGGHNLKFGGEFREMRLNFYQFNLPSGEFDSNDSWTRQYPQSYDGSTGFSLASFLLGLPNGGQITADPTYITTSQYVAFYGQDDWKISPKLTLNYGLRWDFEVPRVEQHNQMAFWDPTATSPLQTYSAQLLSNVSAAGESCPYCGNLHGAITLVGQPGAEYGRRQGPIQKHDFGPRLGLAYNIKPQIVIRGGVGVVYQPSALQAAGTSGGAGSDGFSASTNYQPTFNSQTSLPVASLYSPDPALPASAQQPFPNGYGVAQGLSPTCLQNPACVQGIDVGGGIGASYFDSYRNPYSIQWNANVQFSAPWGVKVELGYLGNRGLFLVNGDPGKPYDQLAPNTLIANGCTVGATTAQCKLSKQVPNPFQSIIGPGSPFYVPGVALGGATVSAAQLQRRYPQYVGITPFRKPDSDSRYNGFTVGMQKAATNGLTFTLSITHGLEYDDAASPVNYLGATSQTYANQYNPKGEWSIGAQNVAYSIVSSFIYELPFGRGKQFLNSDNAGVDKVINGWQVSGIENWSTGTPVVLGSVDNGTTRETYLGAAQRPDWTGTTARLAHKSYHLWFNPNVFSMPLSYEIGNAPRTLRDVNNPNSQNFDLQFAKNTYFGSESRYRAQFRLEMFNALNHPNLGAPGTSITSATFGQIQSYSGTARRLQFGAKFNF